MISGYLRAGYPALYVVSPERGRVRAELFGMARSLTRLDGSPNPRSLVLWDALAGLEKVSGEQGEKRESVGGDTDDPVSALTWAREVEKSLVVFFDFHHFLRDPHVQCAFVRACEQVKTRFTTLVVVSAVQVIPPELEKLVTVVDFPFPDAPMRGRILDAIACGRAQVANGAREALLEASAGLTEAEAENAFALSLVSTGGLDPSFVMGEKAQAVRRSGVLEYYRPDATMEGIGGLEHLKEWLRRRGRAFLPEARTFGLPEPKGVLVTGIPGTGKSLTAKAAAAAWQKPLLRLDVGRVFGSLVGESEANIRLALKTAEAIAPCVLWLDEIEKAFAGVGGSLDSGTSARVFGSFLTWMQEKQSPVFVFATANDVSAMPPELLRKGRFDEIFFVELPTAQERAVIFGIHLARLGRDASAFDCGALAERTKGWTGAEIEAAVVEALYGAFDAGRELAPEDLEQAIRETVPLAETMKERIDALRSWAKGRARRASVSEAETHPEGRAL
jgi:AAA+ superfamily predicted ATPase